MPSGKAAGRDRRACLAPPSSPRPRRPRARAPGRAAPPCRSDAAGRSHRLAPAGHGGAERTQRRADASRSPARLTPRCRGMLRLTVALTPVGALVCTIGPAPTVTSGYQARSAGEGVVAGKGGLDLLVVFVLGRALAPPRRLHLGQPPPVPHVPLTPQREGRGARHSTRSAVTEPRMVSASPCTFRKRDRPRSGHPRLDLEPIHTALGGGHGLDGGRHGRHAHRSHVGLGLEHDRIRDRPGVGQVKADRDDALPPGGGLRLAGKLEAVVRGLGPHLDGGEREDAGEHRGARGNTCGHHR